ncbi:MAG: acyltransferase [Chloroflexi bacterium]|nr:acyltransferase [Chloroflexota bacterium]
MYTDRSQLGLHRRAQPTIDRRPTRNTHVSYLPGLDGLRAFAVLVVLLYHAGDIWPGMPGGFLGVEIFFVISGYLITALLLGEWRQHGRIDLVNFWLRRARRLLPALFVLIIATLAYAVLFLPDEVALLRGDALASFAYITNWHFILSQKSYFATVGRPSLLQHLWSLAVEEQFYLLWPPLLAFALRRWPSAKVLRIILLGAGISTLLMAILYQLTGDPSRVYYGTDTRAAGLLIGAALACVWIPGGDRQSRVSWFVPPILDLIGLGALAALVWYCLRINAYQPGLYRGGFLVVSITTAVLIAVAVHPRAHLSALLLDSRVARWIGVRSYSIYLWHWPVFMLTRPQLDLALTGWPLLVLRLVITLILSELSFRYIEMPMRSGALGHAWRSLRIARGAQRWRLGLRWLAATGTIILLSLLLGRAVANARPPATPEYLAESTTPTPTSEQAQPSPSDAPPSSTPTPSGPVTAVGDSVMNGAQTALTQSIGAINVDAAQARQADDLIALLQAKQTAGQLGQIVVVHIGNNGPITAEQFDQMMQALAGVPKVVVVNVKVPRFWEGPNNGVLAEGIKRYANTMLVDWYGASSSRPELFWDDGIHLRPEGATVYAELVAGAVK